MAEQLQAMQREFQTINDVVNQKLGLAQAYQRMLEAWPNNRQQILKEVTARAKALKPQSEEQIRGDNEIKALERELHGADKDISSMAVFVKSFGAPTASRVQALETRLTREIATRTKAFSTKVGLGNKSLPEMRALLVQVQRLKQSDKYRVLTGLKAEDYNGWQTQITLAIQHEIHVAATGRSW